MWLNQNPEFNFSKKMNKDKFPFPRRQLWALCNSYREQSSNDLVKSLAAAPHIPCILALGLNRSHTRETKEKFPQAARSGNDELLETEARSLYWKKFGFNSLIWLEWRLEAEASLFLVPLINGLPTHFCSRQGRENPCSLAGLLPISFPTECPCGIENRLYLSKMLLLLSVYEVQEKPQLPFISLSQDTEWVSCCCHIPPLQLQHRQPCTTKVISKRAAKCFLEVFEGLFIPSWGLTSVQAI